MSIARLKDACISYKIESQGEPLVMIMGFSAGRSGWAAHSLSIEMKGAFNREVLSFLTA